jgi:hypothetical protein
MTLTLVETARWHAHQAKVTTGADRDFHAEAAKVLRDLAKRRPACFDDRADCVEMSPTSLSVKLRPVSFTRLLSVCPPHPDVVAHRTVQIVMRARTDGWPSSIAIF